MDNLINHPGIIAAFSAVVIFMLLLDLGIFNKKSHVVSNKEAAIWSLVWISISMIFSVFVYIITNENSGTHKFFEFQSAYWIEKALSVDNLFVFILVFGYFNVPKEFHHKVLFYGVLGAILMRAFFIFTGVGLINLTYLPAFQIFNFKFVLDHHIEGISIDYSNLLFFRPNIILSLFGIFLIFAGIKSWFADDEDDNEKDFSKSPGARIIYKIFNVSKEFDQDRFFTIENGVKLATPLLVVVGVIEFTDLLFAVDSIPAIFGQSNDPFILYTSNIFAILGLRSLYFLLANSIHMFSRLKFGLAIILAFIGFKMVFSPILNISPPISLAIVGSVLVLSILASKLFPLKK